MAESNGQEPPRVKPAMRAPMAMGAVEKRTHRGGALMRIKCEDPLAMTRSGQGVALPTTFSAHGTARTRAREREEDDEGRPSDLHPTVGARSRGALSCANVGRTIRI